MTPGVIVIVSRAATSHWVEIRIHAPPPSPGYCCAEVCIQGVPGLTARLQDLRALKISGTLSFFFLEFWGLLRTKTLQNNHFRMLGHQKKSELWHQVICLTVNVLEESLIVSITHREHSYRGPTV